MTVEDLRIGMEVRHPQYGLGVVKKLTEQAADILFNDGMRTVVPGASGLSASQPTAALSGMDIPLDDLIRKAVNALVHSLGLERPDKDELVEDLGVRWLKGQLILQPGNDSQPKEVPLEVFFHKIVMIRDNLRLMEQKVNSNKTLSDADKIELQQYITRSYGSLTTFNVLFKEKEMGF